MAAAPEQQQQESQQAAAAASSPSSSDGGALRAAIARTTRRVRARLALRSGSTGLLIGAGVSAVLVGLLRGNLLSLDNWPGGEGFLILPILAGATFGGLMGAARRINPLAVARLLDERLDLKERFSTALSLEGGSSDPYVARQRADAETRAAEAITAGMRRVVPLTPLPKHAYIALGLTASVFLGWLLPTLPAFQSKAKQAEHTEVKKEGDRLLRIAKDLEAKAATHKLPQTQRTAQQIKALAQEMQHGKLSKQKALMKLAKLSSDLREQQRALAEGQTDPSKNGANSKSLPAAGRDLEQALKEAGGQQPDAAKNGLPNGLTPPQNGSDSNNQQKNAAGNKSGSPSDQAVRNSANALKQNDAPTLAEQLSKLADQAQKGEPKTAEERAKLAKQAEALGKALENTKLSPASQPLKDAAEKLRKGDMNGASSDLREASRRVGEGQRQQEESNSLQQAADSLQNRDSSGQQDGSDSGQQQGDQQQAGDGAQPGDQGEGQGKKDAFDSDGNAKGKNGQDGQGQGQGQKGKGSGKGGTSVGQQGSGNGIGNGAGTPGGKKKGSKPNAGGQYEDPTGAQSGMYDGKSRTKQVRDDKSSRLYAPQNDTRVQGKRGDQGKESISYFRGAPDKRQAATPYYEVYERYAPAAESAVNREDIPASYKKQVKDYFNSLRPEGKPK